MYNHSKNLEALHPFPDAHSHMRIRRHRLLSITHIMIRRGRFQKKKNIINAIIRSSSIHRNLRRSGKRRQGGFRSTPPAQNISPRIHQNCADLFSHTAAQYTHCAKGGNHHYNCSLEAGGERAKILVITGGFHTPGLLERLSGENWKGTEEAAEKLGAGPVISPRSVRTGMSEAILYSPLTYAQSTASCNSYAPGWFFARNSQRPRAICHAQISSKVERQASFVRTFLPVSTSKSSTAFANGCPSSPQRPSQTRWCLCGHCAG